MPAATRAAGSRPSRAPVSCASTTCASRPASRSARTSPTHRIGRRPPATARSSFLPIELVRLAEVGAALGVAEDDPRGEAGQHRDGDLAGVGPGQLVVDVLGTDAHVLARQRVAHGGEAHVRRADHPGDAGLPRAGRDGPREVAGVGGGGVHLPVGGNHDRASCPHHARGARPFPRPTGPPAPAARPGPRRPGDSPEPAPDGRSAYRRPIPSSSCRARRSIRSSARWTAERWRSRRTAISDSDASGVSRRASATARTVVGCSREAAVRLERVDRRRAGGRRPRRTAGGWRTRR